jgi:AraC-like DNA-binding protein
MRIKNTTAKNELNDLIKEFVLLTNDSSERQAIISVDDACNDFMFLQDSTIKIKYGGKRITKTNLPVYTHRLEPPWEFIYDSHVSYFIIKVHPWANSAYFPYKTPYGIKDVSELYGESIVDLHSRVFKAKSFDECVQASEEFLEGLKITIDSNMILVKNICNKIYETNGMITVNDLSDMFEMSRQTLNKIFFTYVNYTTKYFIILVRILSASKFKLNNPSCSLTELACEFGYTDQSHFIYDFKRMSGVKPSQLFNNPPAFLQRHKK